MTQGKNRFLQSLEEKNHSLLRCLDLLKFKSKFFPPSFLLFSHSLIHLGETENSPGQQSRKLSQAHLSFSLNTSIHHQKSFNQ